MKKTHVSAWEQVNLAAKVADLKDDHYRTLLSLSAILEILIEKGLLTQEELEQKTVHLDQELGAVIAASLHPMG
ncbi:hypothetical protein [Paenibacillus abyssi]|uniref:Nitrile hydratase subunit beta n=1 Tax=Paenibacillus abyssi TaxID=1340531 RepID=A0A917FP24_9BACL|nr:hypothetical protein [Paenibacillus abyssi]GGF93997.1 hypothetical protein GCM10010916_09170 [Paenibacillus abyssi]